ncbi:hypothetical protein C8R44DRAFT_791514 [Mycena epipterygia]|nr:hypothetical protein C8R44DRAFT_791514 [Mycena epipterygia]
MHHCSRIPEIVGMICVYLDLKRDPKFVQHQLPGASKQPWLRDLAAVARTCMDLHGPSLDSLWRSAFENLLLCMPSDVWALDEPNRPRRIPRMRLLRPIRVTDWDRIFIYASRVRQLVSDFDESMPISNIFPAISGCLPHDLFPNLQNLHWRHSDPDFHYIYLFLRRSVTTIRFWLPSDLPIPFLSTLAFKCPKLTNVDIQSKLGLDNSDLGPEAEAVSLFVCELQHIEKLAVQLLNQNALQHISRLTSLRSLDVNTFPPGLSFSPIDEDPMFTGLRELALGYPDIESATQFLRLFDQVHLEYFHVCSFQLPTTGQTHNFYTTFTKSFAPSFLTFLTVECDDGGFDIDILDPGDYVVGRNTVRTLLCFINLTSLYIRSPVGFDLDNGQCRCIRYGTRMASDRNPGALGGDFR